MSKLSWNLLKKTLDEIKKELFLSGVVDVTKPYSIDSVENLRLLHSSSFGKVKKETFYTLFKRAFCEVILDQELEEHYSKKKNTTSSPPKQQQQEDIHHHQRQQQTKRKKAKGPTPRRVVPTKLSERNMTKKLCFPSMVVPWSTFSGDRVHVYLFPPSGFSIRHVFDVAVQNGKLILKVEWPSVLLGTKKLFGHPEFNRYYDRPSPHPKMVSYESKIDDLIGENDKIESTISVDLPGNNYELTEEKESGHNFIEETECEQEEGDVALDPTVVWLIDLSKSDARKERRFSKVESSKMVDRFTIG
ncbi:hypothetical protein ACHAWC_003616 [Mediolabrus comicus]